MLSLREISDYVELTHWKKVCWTSVRHIDRIYYIYGFLQDN